MDCAPALGYRPYGTENAPHFSAALCPLHKSMYLIDNTKEDGYVCFLIYAYLLLTIQPGLKFPQKQ